MWRVYYWKARWYQFATCHSLAFAFNVLSVLARKGYTKFKVEKDVQQVWQEEGAKEIGRDYVT